MEEHAEAWGEAERLAIELVNRPCVPTGKMRGHQGCQEPDLPDNPPDAGGVYLFRKDQDIIYVGLTRTLRKRILSDYLGYRRNSIRCSRDFKVKVAEHERLNIGDVSKWLRENCSVSWIVIPNSDTRGKVEKLLIAWKRPTHNRNGLRWTRSPAIVEIVTRLRANL